MNIKFSIIFFIIQKNKISNKIVLKIKKKNILKKKNFYFHFFQLIYLIIIDYRFLKIEKIF